MDVRPHWLGVRLHALAGHPLCAGLAAVLAPNLSFAVTCGRVGGPRYLPAVDFFRRRQAASNSSTGAVPEDRRQRERWCPSIVQLLMSYRVADDTTINGSDSLSLSFEPDLEKHVFFSL